MDDHDECEVDEGDEALHTCPSDEDVVESSDQLSESESDSQCCHLKCVYTAFWVFIILTRPSVLQELDFITYTRGRGWWYFRPSSREGLANFTPIPGMVHLTSEPKFKISKGTSFRLTQQHNYERDCLRNSREAHLIHTAKTIKPLSSHTLPCHTM